MGFDRETLRRITERMQGQRGTPTPRQIYDQLHINETGFSEFHVDQFPSTTVSDDIKDFGYYEQIAIDARKKKAPDKIQGHILRRSARKPRK